MEAIFIGWVILLVISGRYLENIIPRITGIPKIRKIL